ncbi:hypothetical protein HPB49_007999 [Dermacentor silvarum]|uniref:Uncharacterized protein n=1 Tax=Dermacentor silvarum TaxID=543639 RepID=A0ACB8CVY9_DERSI|nr:hypothetical protein HPB49_007999 [Dermacentor silvarum]
MSPSPPVATLKRRRPASTLGLARRWWRWLEKALFCMGRVSGFVSASQFSQLDEKQFRECPIADPRSTVLVVCYTSGTTGMPKAAEITHYNYVACFYTTR